MTNWINLPITEQKELLGLVSQRTGLPAYAIEKDWWVTLALYAIFNTPWKENLVFKGGTSLSKSWGLIERFSEDIDLVLDRSVLGFGEHLSKSQVAKLRKASCAFTSGPFKDTLQETLIQLGIPVSLFELKVADTTESDRDPQILELYYVSALEKNTYLKEAVLIEIGARSLREPSEQKLVSSILSANLDAKTAGETFSILTVTPVRTFLEKVFLLHEEFSKPADKIKTERMSRHLYDLEKIMDTEYGKTAIQDIELYNAIIEHRAKFNNLRGISYDQHDRKQINFIPPDQIMTAWEADYKEMQNSMIYGSSLPFGKLIDRMKELQHRFNHL